MMLSLIFKKMKLIHSVTNIGGSLTAPGNQVVGLVGMTAKVVPILVFDQSISANLNSDMPFVKYIPLVRSKADYDGLEFKPSEKYIGASFVLLPPFLTKVAIDTAALFTKFMVAMIIFDRKNPPQDESTWTETGCSLQFFWSASQNHTRDAVFELIDDEKVDIWQELHYPR